MTARRINLESRHHPDPQRVAWFEANGIDPRQVPVAQEVLVEDGQLTVVLFDWDELGRCIVDEGTETLAKSLHTVPLVSPPENWGL